VCRCARCSSNRSASHSPSPSVTVPRQRPSSNNGSNARSVTEQLTCEAGIAVSRPQGRGLGSPQPVSCLPPGAAGRRPGASRGWPESGAPRSGPARTGADSGGRG
jgi:hypothetical protein